MSNYELYEKVVEAYKLGDEGLFNAAVRNWMVNVEPVDFKNNEANELFLQARNHFGRWNANGIDSRVSKRRMLKAVRELAAIGLPNPYLKEVKKIAAEDPVKVLGVLPSEHESEPAAAQELVVATEEKKDEKQHFFGRKNKK